MVNKNCNFNRMWLFVAFLCILILAPTCMAEAEERWAETAVAAKEQREKSNYKESERLYKEALRQAESYFNEDDIRVTASLLMLADFYVDTKNIGKLGFAEALVKRQQEILQQRLGKDSPGLFSGLELLGQIYQAQGKYKQAEQVLEHALATCPKTGGLMNSDWDTEILTLLGRCAALDHDYYLAIKYFRQAVQTFANRKAQEENEYIKRAYLISYIADNFEETSGADRYQEAERYRREALSIIRAHYWPRQFKFLQGELEALSMNLQKQSRFREAEEFALQKLANTQKQFGLQSQETVKELSSLADLCELAEDYGRAENTRRQLIALCERKPECAELVLTQLLLLAMDCQVQWKLKDAQFLEEREIRMCAARKRGQSAKKLALNKMAGLRALALNMFLQKQYDLSRKYCKNILDSQISADGDNGVVALGLMAQIEEAVGNYERALQLLDECDRMLVHQPDRFDSRYWCWRSAHLRACILDHQDKRDRYEGAIEQAKLAMRKNCANFQHSLRTRTQVTMWIKLYRFAGMSLEAKQLELLARSRFGKINSPPVSK